MVKNMHFISYLNLFDLTSSFLARFKVRIQYPTFSLQEFTAGHLLFFIFFFQDPRLTSILKPRILHPWLFNTFKNM